MAKSPIRRSKAPGMRHLVVWRQLFMVAGVLGMSAPLLPALGVDNENALFGTLALAVPALLHGQLWKWTYDWADRGAATVRSLRIGEVVCGALHSGLSAWAVVLVLTAAAPQPTRIVQLLLYVGLVAGVWETVRPAMALAAKAPDAAEPPDAPAGDDEGTAAPE